MNHKLYLYPVWLRSWHALNAVLFIVLIATGLSMQYTGAAGWLVSSTSELSGNNFLFPFKTAVKWHNIAALFLCINYLFFILANWLGGNIKYYKPDRDKLFQRLLKQARYYAWGIFKGEEHPFPVTLKDKFNPLQKISYILVMYLGLPLLILSGVGMFFPELVPDRVFNVSGLLINDLIHITTGFTLSLFMIIHIYLCTLGKKPSTLFKCMINGYHET